MRLSNQQTTLASGSSGSNVQQVPTSRRCLSSRNHPQQQPPMRRGFALLRSSGGLLGSARRAPLPLPNATSSRLPNLSNMGGTIKDLKELELDGDDMALLDPKNLRNVKVRVCLPVWCSLSLSTASHKPAICFKRVLGVHRRARHVGFWCSKAVRPDTQAVRACVAHGSPLSILLVLHSVLRVRAFSSHTYARTRIQSLFDTTCTPALSAHTHTHSGACSFT